MSDYGAVNCTASEKKELRFKLHSYCMEGGYCRKMPPNKLYCQCLPGWKNDICDTPDFLGADLKLEVVIPLVVLVVIIIIVVVTILAVKRYRQRREKEQERQGQSSNPLCPRNRPGNQPIYRAGAGGGAGSTTPPSHPPPYETEPRYQEYLA